MTGNPPDAYSSCLSTSASVPLMDLRIAAFITASTFAHGAAVLWPATAPHQQLSVGGETRALQVALLPPAARTGQDAEKPHTTQPRIPEDNPASSMTIQSRHVTPASAMTKTSGPAVTRHAATETQHTDNTAQHLAAQDSEALSGTSTRRPATQQAPAAMQHSSTQRVSESISAALRNRLTKYFEYPWLAQQRGWEGRVLLSLRVASNGNLSEWKIVQTSGYRTLDQSALRAVRRIEHLPQAGRWLKSGSLEVQLPVQYKLLDS